MSGYNIVLEDSNSLAHHGIKGMKWGVRRYQNPDGSLTAAGMERYNKDFAKQAKKAVNRDNKTPHRLDNIQSLVSKNLTDKQKETLYKKHQKYVDTIDASVKAEEEFERENGWDTANKAYEDTRKWFQKYDPETLNQIIGDLKAEEKEWDLNNDKRFYDLYSRTEIDYTDKAKKRFYKEKGYDKIEKQNEKAWKEYNDYQKELTNNLVGKYGDIQMKNVVGNTRPLSSFILSGVDATAVKLQRAKDAEKVIQNEALLQKIGKQARDTILKSDKEVEQYRKAFSDWDKTNDYWYGNKPVSEAQKKHRYAAEAKEQKIFDNIVDAAYKEVDKSYGNNLSDIKKREIARSAAERAVGDIWDEEVAKNRSHNS